LGSVRLTLSAKISQSWNNIFLSPQISISIAKKNSQPNKAGLEDDSHRGLFLSQKMIWG
jgi:hypothetical protein